MCQKTPTRKTSIIPNIICITIATFAIAVIGYFSLSPFWFWICWVFVGAGLVAIGCIGEWYLFINPAPESDECLKSHHRRREFQFITAVAIGVTMDFIGLFHEIPEAVRLEKDVVEIGTTNAQLVADNLVSRSNVAALELRVMETSNKIAQTSTKVESQDPYKQPITALTATVSFQCFDPFMGILSMEGKNGVLGDLTFFNRTNNDFPKLVFISNTLKPLVPGDDPAHMRRYFLVFNLSEFRQDRGPSQDKSYSIPIEIVGKNVDFINGFNSLTLKLFIKTNRPPPPLDGRMIIDGKATLVANSVLKEFALSSVTNPTNNPVILTGFPMPDSK
jgi:hypothetical protein